MIKTIRTFLVLTFLAGISVFSQNGSDCITPNEENAKCIPAVSCQPILQAIQTKNQTVVKFAQDSNCGFDGNVPLVCCGSVGYPRLRSNLLDDLLKELDPSSVQGTVGSRNINTKKLPDRSVCGLEKDEYRIWGGEETELNEFPWMALLEYKWKKDGKPAETRCGGSLINERYVLTAAHCLYHREFEVINVRLGEWNLSSNPDCQQVAANRECADAVLNINVEETIPHPFYSKINKVNDIGLIKLAKDVTFTDYIRPICLPPHNAPIPPYSTLFTVAGWGATENATRSDIKLKVDVPLLPNAKCVEKLRRDSMTSSNLCAGGEAGKDSCRGDSGGPLMRTYTDETTKRRQWFQEGIVSYGVGCGAIEYPAVYTRVSRYTNWIINSLL